MKHLFTLAVLLMALPLTAQAQTTYYVKSLASGANGLSWSDAFPTLQNALAAATAGDRIFIAAGIYYPHEGTGQTDGDRDASFTLVSAPRSV